MLFDVCVGLCVLLDVCVVDVSQSGCVSTCVSNVSDVCTYIRVCVVCQSV